MNNISLLIRFILAVAFFMLVGGLLVSYNKQDYHFDGITFDELTQSYIAKNDVKFSDLPLDVQAQYVEKERVIYTKEEGALDAVVLDESGMPLLDEQADPADFQKAIELLQNKIAVLESEKVKTKQETDAFVQKLEEQALKQRDIEQFYKEIHQEILVDKEAEIQILHKQLNQNESALVKLNKQEIKTLKEQLVKAEQTHVSDESKYKLLQEEYQRKEQSYLNQLQEIKKLSKLQEENLLLAKKEIEKKLLSTEDTIKTLQAKIKSLETRQSAKVSEK